MFLKFILVVPVIGPSIVFFGSKKNIAKFRAVNNSHMIFCNFIAFLINKKKIP